MKKFYRFLTVLVAVASIGVFGCHHSFQEETPEKAKTGYGNLTVKFSGTPEEGSALENCSITSVQKRRLKAFLKTLTAQLYTLLPI